MTSGLVVLTGAAHKRARHAREISLRGFTVVEADDHNDALRRIGSTTPTLFVLMLSVTDGKKVVEQARKRHTGTYPILFVIDGLTLTDMETGLRAGGDDFLIKPTTEELLKRVTVWQKPAKRARIDSIRKEALDRVVIMNQTGEVSTGSSSSLDDLLLFNEDDLIDFAKGGRDLPDGLSDDDAFDGMDDLDDLLSPESVTAPLAPARRSAADRKNKAAGKGRKIDALDQGGDDSFLADLVDDPQDANEKVWS